MKKIITTVSLVVLFVSGYCQSATDHFNKGLIKYKSKDYKGAIEDLDKELKLKPGDVDAYNLKGLAYYSLNMFVQAIQNFNKTLELDPGYCICNVSDLISSQIDRALRKNALSSATSA
jgi:tetratricopeptide (TPR) repeat protein